MDKRTQFTILVVAILGLAVIALSVQTSFSNERLCVKAQPSHATECVTGKGNK